MGDALISDLMQAGDPRSMRICVRIGAGSLERKSTLSCGCMKRDAMVNGESFKCVKKKVG